MSTVTHTNTAAITSVSYKGPNSYYLINRGSVDDEHKYIQSAVYIAPSGTVFNAGTIIGADLPHYYAVALRSGGELTNALGATIDGWYGVDIAGAAGTVVNSGTLMGNYSFVYSAGQPGYPDQVLPGSGVRLHAGGTIINNLGALIKGFYAVSTDDVAATIANAGTIAGYRTGVGINLGAGGEVTNQRGGTISGKLVIVTTTNSYSKIANYGVIHSNDTMASDASAYGVTLSGAASITNGASGTISGFHAVVARGNLDLSNAGTIASNPGYNRGSGYVVGGTGIIMSGGGTLTNTASGVITGAAGIGADYVAATVVNQGTIISAAAATLANGVVLFAGGTLDNAAGAYISAGYWGVGLVSAFFSFTHPSAGFGDASIVNAGTISGRVAGIEAQVWSNPTYATQSAQDHIVNAAGGVIEGAAGVDTSLVGPTGNIQAMPATVTLENAGTIIGSGGQAVAFDFAADRLIVDQGAVFQGAVNGGGGALELGTASHGVILGLGSAFSGFGSLQVDAGQTWTTGGSLAAPVTLGMGAALTNSLGGVLGAVAAAGGPVTLENAGTIGSGAGAAVSFGGGGTLVLDQGAAFRGSVQGGGGVLVLGTASAGIVSGLGSQYSGFASLVVEAGQTWSVSGTLTGPVSVGAGAGLTNSQGGVLGPVTFQGTGGTLEDAGTIAQYMGISVLASAANTVVVDQGATFAGLVIGGGGTLVLGSASNGVIVGLGGQIVGFGTLAVEAGQSWTSLGAFAGSYATVGSGAVFDNQGTIGCGLTGGSRAVIDNAGVVAAGSSGPDSVGVALSGGGAVHNLAGAVIAGTTGVLGYGTVENAGTITGDGGVALQFQTATNAESSVLVLDQGATFKGSVLGDGGRLVLASATAGTLSNLGAAFQDFAAVVVDRGQSWSLGGANTVASGTSLQVTGTLSLTSASVLQEGAAFIGPQGTIALGAGSSWTISAASSTQLGELGHFDNAGLLTGAGGHDSVSVQLVNTGTASVTQGVLNFAGRITNDGTMLAGAGATLLVSADQVTGRGQLDIATGGSLILLAGTGTGQRVDFGGGVGRLALGAPASFHGAVTGFQAGDQIDLLQTAADGLVFANHTLSVTSAGVSVAALHFLGVPSGNDFRLATDHHGGVMITYR